MKHIHTDKAPAAIGPYSQAIISGNFLFASGQTATIPETGKVAGTDVAAQAEQTCLNIKAVLEEAGLTFDNVVKATCFLADINDFAAFNEVYGRYFTSKPARSCFAAKDLPKGFLCEVEVIAEIE